MSASELIVNIKLQQLLLCQNNLVLKKYPISTAQNGVGEAAGSFCTPRGKHLIRAKIGANAPLNAVFVGRRLTGEIYTTELGLQFPERDWILTRILWLSGMEKGKNRLGNCDTMRRFIYIHGTNQESLIGTPCSRGCIRMLNQDIIELFDKVAAGNRVQINE
jgi:L,D-transpeptidase YbiS